MIKPMTNSKAIACHQLTKHFGNVPAVRAASFSLESGAFMALLGPSGCGKTTILRMIAGLETPESGTITICGRVVSGSTRTVPAHERRVGMVFQDYALFPHMTVEKNVAYGLARGSEKSIRVNEVLDLVGLTGLHQRYPHEISGGQQQRVALARALAPQPDILLLDEPFSNLDIALRTQVREDIRRILHEAGVTAILVTHDQDEAMSLASQIALMFDGVIVQCGPPRDLYERPISRRAAQFLGEANVLPGQAQDAHVLTALGTFPLVRQAAGKVDVLVRPEQISLAPAAPDISRAQRVVIERTVYYGTHQDVWVVTANSLRIKVRCTANARWRAGEPAAIMVSGQALAYAAQ